MIRRLGHGLHLAWDALGYLAIWAVLLYGWDLLWKALIP